MAEGMHLDWTKGLAVWNQALSRFATQVEHTIDQTVRATAIRVLDLIKTMWPVDTGVSRAAWWGPQRLGPAWYQIGNPTPYAITIEFGLYTGVGPRTEAIGAIALGNGMYMTDAGIFSTQAHAPVRRALADVAEAFQTELAGAVRQAWRA